MEIGINDYVSSYISRITKNFLCIKKEINIETTVSKFIGIIIVKIYN